MNKQNYPSIIIKYAPYLFWYQLVSFFTFVSNDVAMSDLVRYVEAVHGLYITANSIGKFFS